VAFIMQNIYGYTRVSTKEQNEDRQVEALLDFGVSQDNIFIDKKSGKDFDREQYQLMKQIMKRTKDNVLVIKSIDRMGRNYKEIQDEWRQLTNDYGIDIVVLDMELLDTRKNKGLLGNFISDLVLQILSYVAEQERINIRSRQEEGIKVAKQKGKKFGRPKLQLPKDFKIEYDKWKSNVQTAKETMDKLNLKRTKFYSFIKEYEK
jgi:DNA invertase Pin-like site-specific DNA recombinase